MMGEEKIFVVIPAFNEEKSITKVIKDIPKELVDQIIVVDNNSTDDTYQKVLDTGSIALKEPRQGYGYACLKGIEHAIKNDATIIVFLDGDYSDYPEELRLLVEPIIAKEYDFVLGSRAMGKRQRGSMTPQQVFGNWLATTLIRWFYNVKYTDLGPFRAIRVPVLQQMNMQDKTYGWTVEMQLKAAKMKVKTLELSVNYRPRIGVSKVSGTVKGTIMAGYKIITWIFKYL